MSLLLRGIGTAVPKHSIDQRHAAELAKAFCGVGEEQLRIVPALYRRAGVRRRHSVVLESLPPTVEGESAASRRVHDQAAATAIGTTTTAKRAAKVGEIDVRQIFYEPMTGPEDCGPTTAQRMHVYEQRAGELASHAASRAIANSGIDRSSVTHLITVSCTGFSAPGVDLQLIEKLALPKQVSRTHLGFMGCHGALNALRVARAYCDSQPDACVLICAVELCSLHHQYGWHPEQIVANALFADGAAAVVGTSVASEQTRCWQVIANGSVVLDDSDDAMTWKVRDHGFEMSLSPHVPDLISAELRPWLASWLKQLDLKIEDVGSWAIHPGGPRILSAAAESVGVSALQLSASQEILANYGNMSSPTVLFILDRLIREDAARPCVMLAFGPGLSVEAALVR